MLNKIFTSLFISLMSYSLFLSAEIEYDIQDIGTLQTRASQAIALNNNGQILGWYNIDGTTEGKQFFVRDRNESFHEITIDSSSVAFQDFPKGLREGLRSNPIDWKYLTDEGKAYGLFHWPEANPILFMWEQESGVINLGRIPGEEISAINNSGQVLIKYIVENENGKSIRRPAIWENGIITTLRGLEGDLGIESEESYGIDMNNNGEVVGRSFVYMSYKNDIYKQMHATKWVNGQALDIHNKIPKQSASSGILINDLGDVFLNQFLIKENGEKIALRYGSELKKGGQRYFFNEQCVLDLNGVIVSGLNSASCKVLNDVNSIWMTFNKIESVNDSGEILAQGTTIYGELHAVLLIPMASEEQKDKNVPKVTSDYPNKEITKEELEVLIKNTIDAAFLYHTEGISEKVQLLFIEHYGRNQNFAWQVQVPYRRILMIEALERIIEDIENLSVSLKCENNILFWEIVQVKLKEKSQDWKQSVDAYIKIKTCLLN